ncbi:MAG: hypothetical protein KF758_13750 [Anaerolineales bacterium]|nr:hypothetical protein [Anaerolineales bacterium]MBX3037969.1 hypothetical protein [Anaerolineales bacterium]
MKKVRVAVFIILIILLMACQPSVDVPLTATSTPKPTNTLIPPTATITPFPPLDEEGPYLILENFSEKEIIIYDGDGIGRKNIELPKDSHTGLFFPYSISPNGEWMAFFTGSIGLVDGFKENLPVTIKLLNLRNNKIVEITNIVAEGYQEKLEKVIDALKAQFPNYFQSDSDIDLSGAITSTFPWGIYSVKWSPNSRYIAFAGQIDDVSSDVYIYDIEGDEIKRVNDDIQNVSNISWSPNSEYVILYNQMPDHLLYGSTSMHFIKLSDILVKNPKSLWQDTWGGIVDWLSEDTLLMTGGTHTAGNSQLLTLNIETGKTKVFWDELYGETAIDHQNSIIAMTTTYYNPPENPGIYFIGFEGKNDLVFNGYYYNIVFRGGEKYRFLALEYPSKNNEMLKSLALDGTTKQLSYLENYKTSISPDYSWLIVYNNEEIDLYDENDDFVANLEISGVIDITWRLDSKGFFYSTGKDFYYFDMQERGSNFVDTCITENCFFHFDERYSIWVP